MTKLTFPTLLAACVIAAGLSTYSIGQQGEQASGTTASGTTASTATGADKSDPDASDNQRLPPGYSDIITHSQRRKIYAIQMSYQEQIDVLQAQIRDIETQRDAAIEKVLEPDQKEVLKFILKIRERNRQEVAASQQKSEAGTATPNGSSNSASNLAP